MNNNEDVKALAEEIAQLKKERDAVILAHYYARPEVQAVADILGDSLALSQLAATTEAKVIVFCGVHFMAETAAIISPEKKVLSYVNTSAAVKAETDYCVTSANALKVIETLPLDVPILFGPDKNLGEYINLKTGRNMDLWQGDCYVHRHITGELIREYLERYPNADILIHPESVACGDKSILEHPRCFVGSTSGILKHPEQSEKKQFVVATEKEAITELVHQYPRLEFIPITREHYCEYMKLTTLTDLRDALRDEKHVVTIDPKVRERALLPIQRMLAIK